MRPQLTVAIVEDDPSMLGAIQGLLEAHGYATLLFTSAEDFLKRDITKHVDRLLLDIALAGMSGIELSRRLKSAGSQLPVIFMTALDDNDIYREAMRAGGVACLYKPFESHDLIEVIENSAPQH